MVLQQQPEKADASLRSESQLGRQAQGDSRRGAGATALKAVPLKTEQRRKAAATKIANAKNAPV